MTRLNFSGFNTNNWPYVHLRMSESPGSEYAHRVELKANKPLHMQGEEICQYIREMCRGKVYVTRLLPDNIDDVSRMASTGALPGSSSDKFPAIGIYFTKNSDVLLFKMCYSEIMAGITTGPCEAVRPWYIAAERRRIEDRRKKRG